MTDLVNIFEKRVLTNVRLTQHQMKVLAMILASPEGVAPDEDISKGPNLTTARKLLTKLGMITHDGDNKYSVSETGMKVAKDENIIDETGQLTEVGNELAYEEDKQAPSVSNGPSGPMDEPPSEPFAQTSTEVGLPGPSESFGMIGKLLKESIVESLKFDENFIRSVAKDAGIDLSNHSTADIKKMHDNILINAREIVDDPDMGMSPDDLGQEYYDQAKQYFSR